MTQLAARTGVSDTYPLPSNATAKAALAAMWDVINEMSQAAELDLASAATTNIGGALSRKLRITGTTGITSFGTTYTGPIVLRFAGVLTITHHATTLICPGGLNLVTAAGDVCLAVPKCTASGTFDGWHIMAYQRASGVPLFAGKESIWIPASAMIARITNGPVIGSIETATNKVMIRTLDFDTTTQEFAQFAIRMPKSWNLSTVTATFLWSHASTTVNFGVVWSLAAVAVSDDDALDVALGTAIAVADTGGTTNDLYQSAESAAITVAGTPAALDTVIFQVARVPGDASDTMAIDARLHGVLLNYTTNAGNDA